MKLLTKIKLFLFAFRSLKVRTGDKLLFIIKISKDISDKEMDDLREDLESIFINLLDPIDFGIIIQKKDAKLSIIKIKKKESKEP